MVGLEKAISWQRYKWSTIMKVPGKSANEPTWFQFLSQVCSFYGVGAVKAGKKVVDNRGLTLYGNVREICSKIYNCSINLHRQGRWEMVIEAGMSVNFLICMMLYNVTSITININSP